MKEAFSYPFKKVYLKATFARDVCSSCCMIATTECYNYEIFIKFRGKSPGYTSGHSYSTCILVIFGDICVSFGMHVVT